MNEIKIGLDKIKQAVDVRSAINERYSSYATLSKIVQISALVDHADFKNSVDALYYLGGGWPTPNSKGRMERALDHVAGMYKILTLIGQGQLIENHLADKGINISLKDPIQDVNLSAHDIRLLNEEYGMKIFNFRPETLSELVNMCVTEAQNLQRFICENADIIKHELKPAAKESLQVEDEEYDRLFLLTKLAPKIDKVSKKKSIIEDSVSHYRKAASQNLKATIN